MQVTVVDHPLIKQKITKMRAEHTSSRDFRECLDEIAMLMTYEVARNLPLQEVEVATPVAKTTGYKVAGDIFVVPILRAGLGLLTGVLKMIPDARVGFIGLYRDEETLKPIEYYCKLPDNKDGVTIVVDPTQASGALAYYLGYLHKIIVPVRPVIIHQCVPKIRSPASPSPGTI